MNGSVCYICDDCVRTIARADEIMIDDGSRPTPRAVDSAKTTQKSNS